jgi:SAM-dependent methyltransferase
MLRRIKPLLERTPILGAVYARLALWYHSWPTRGMSPEEAFTHIFLYNGWRGTASRSGGGSDLAQTRRIISELPLLMKEFGIRSMLDLPCGDFYWMKYVDLQGVDYIGGDIVADLISRNKQFESPNATFELLDILSSPLPRVDLIFCRDCLVHFSFKDVFIALQNIVRSGSGLLLTTTFPRHRRNYDIRTGAWRTLNLESPPFGLPKPLRVLEEGCTQSVRYVDKSLGLWRIADLAEAVERAGRGRALA